MERDLSALSHEVRRAARVDANGEVSWPNDYAGAAISELASAGEVVLGLDVRFYDAEGRFYEMPWSSHDPDRSESVAVNADAARIAALARSREDR